MLKKILVLLLFFYYIYPQALSVLGSSYIIAAGPIGLAIYAYHRFPFKEVLYVFISYFILFFWFKTASSMNGYTEPWLINDTRSQLAWFFAAYLTILFMFEAHKKPTIYTLAYYITFAIGLQAAITIAMYFNQNINNFFYSLQLQVDFSETKKDMTEGQRLVGYGSAFFGAGATYGFGLIFNAYLLVKAHLKTPMFIFLAILYCFIFYVGLFSARTTVVGMAVSLILIAFLYFTDEKTNKTQTKSFVITLIFLAIGGYSLASFYFPSMTDWAFELFDNLVNKGSLETQSSNGLADMLYAPKDAYTVFFGRGRFTFMGSDVGFTRLMFYVGVPGMLIYFLFQFSVLKIASTKDWTVNILGYILLIYTLLLNIKGLIAMNFITYLYFFFFMFYKYYIYRPQVYLRNKQIALNKNPQLKIDK